MFITKMTIKEKLDTIWATSHENVSSGIFDQVRFQLSCLTTDAS